VKVSRGQVKLGLVVTSRGHEGIPIDIHPSPKSTRRTFKYSFLFALPLVFLQISRSSRRGDMKKMHKVHPPHLIRDEEEAAELAEAYTHTDRGAF